MRFRTSAFAFPLLATVAGAQGLATAAPTAPTAPASATARPASFHPPDVADVAARVLPSIVTVRAYVRREAGAEVRNPTARDATAAAAASGTGAPGWVAEPLADDYPGFRLLASSSGFIVGEDGEVLTCNHALRRSDGALPDLLDIETHDNARMLAEIVGAEPTVNLAIVQATVFPNGHSKKLPALRFGDSEVLRCGHWILAFGDPAGPEKFFAVGSFVAQPSRDCYQDMLSAFHMQVGLVAHPEAYGGPLVNLDGEVIGILAPRQSAPGVWGAQPRLGIEFGMPSKIVVGLYESIRTTRSFQSPWLGFSVMSRAEIAAVRGLPAYEKLDKPRNGILVENLFTPSPAFEAGIQPGDFLVTFAATRIFTPVDFQRCLYLAGIGAKVKLELYRDGAMFTRDLVVKLRPGEATPR